MSQQNIQACIETPNVQSRDRYSLIDSSNAMFASSEVQAWPSKQSPVESPFCGPHISTQYISHSMTSSIFKKTDLESPLIFILFLKGKQNKKEKP